MTIINEIKKVKIKLISKNIFSPYVIIRIDEACFNRHIMTIGHVPSIKSCMTSGGKDIVGWKPTRSCNRLEPITPINGDWIGLVTISSTKLSWSTIVLLLICVNGIGKFLSVYSM